MSSGTKVAVSELTINEIDANGRIADRTDCESVSNRESSYLSLAWHTFHLKISAQIAANGGLMINVADTGIGTSPSDIPKALEKFGQIDSALDRRYESTGLGLPLAKAQIELHGGTLKIISKLKSGTTVQIRFPPHHSLAPANV